MFQGLAGFNGYCPHIPLFSAMTFQNDYWYFTSPFVVFGMMHQFSLVHLHISSINNNKNKQWKQ